MAPQAVPLEKRIRMSLLLDTYGELLTEKQQRFLRFYYEEDYSFGEIAREYSVTRQAIFDSVKHGEASLENYERVLGIVGRMDGAGEAEPGAGRSGGAETAGRIERCAAELTELAEAVAASSVDGDTTWITRTLRQVIDELGGIREIAAASAAAARGGNHRSLPGEPAGTRVRTGTVLGGDGPEVD